MHKWLEFAVSHPRQVMVALALAVVLALSQAPRMSVDTDPENMLPANSSVRVFDRQMRSDFALNNMLVLGVVNEAHPQGVFNAETLARLHRITARIKEIEGVDAYELLSLSTRDNVVQDGAGAVRFEWLMQEPPATDEEALVILAEARDHPMFRGSIVSDDGRMVSVYIPLLKKSLSYRIAQDVRRIVAQETGPEQYHITGLPVAEDQFGVEMFRQMAVSAPLAGAVIFVLMWLFFRSLALIAAPMIMAVATVIITMGLMIGFGFPVHIMSSMIPIFLMPITILDSVHILSEFSDKYRLFKDRRKAIMHVMGELFVPMLFTSLTSVAGFFSLSFSPIPPVQVFGVFVAIGIALAWLLTMVFIPAYIMLMNEKTFADFGARPSEEPSSGWMDRVLGVFRALVLKRYRLVLVLTALLMALSVYGLTRIQVNDNPVRWFHAGHPIRVADKVLNQHFAGTYEAYLVLEAENKGGELFKEPQMLRYIQGLQSALLDSALVGKTMTLTDLVVKVYDELMGGDKTHARIPDTREAVAQSLLSFENSHKPDDLWHVVTTDYDRLNIWLQLKSGDNKDMARVTAFTARYLLDNPPPAPLQARWAGKTYLNVVWQDNMVMGMIKNFIGSFVIVFFMMLYLFRSPVTALVSMVPLTVTILFIYALLGFVGKDYDMPVAVLSALTLGLSVDFAIHFIQRSMELRKEHADWNSIAEKMFAGPGRAIVRNALVVAIGFLPLMVAPLVPYQTVGFFMFAIMAVSAAATLLIIPALFSWYPVLLEAPAPGGIAGNRGHCLLTAVAAGLSVAYVMWGYDLASWKPTVYVTLAVIVAGAFLCHLVSGKTACRK